MTMIKRILCRAWVWPKAVLILVFLVLPSRGADLTIQDVVDGIDARRAAIKSIEYHYAIETERSGVFFAERKRDFLDDMKRRGEQVTDMELLDLEESSPPRQDLKKYDLFMQDNKIAFAEFLRVEDEFMPLGRGVYDGEVMKYLSIKDKNGHVSPTLREDVVRFHMLTDLFNAFGNKDLGEYVQNPDVEATIVGERTAGEDYIVQLRLRQSKQITSRCEVAGEFLVDVNITKGFWLVRVDFYEEMTDLKTGDHYRALREQVTVDGFLQSRGQGMYFPARTTRETFGYTITDQPGRVVPIIGETKQSVVRESLAIDDVQVNADLPDDVFKLEFPVGTVVQDEIADMGMIIGEPVKEIIENGRLVATYDALDDILLQTDSNPTAPNSVVSGAAEKPREPQEPNPVVQVPAMAATRDIASHHVPLIWLVVIVAICFLAGLVGVRLLAKFGHVGSSQREVK